MNINWRSIHTIVFDFDGVFTDNRVYVSDTGQESVVCDRADGLAFDMLRNFIALNNWNLDYFILSKETNPVCHVRAKKLNIRCVNSIKSKEKYLTQYLEANKKDAEGLIFLGNDLNDLLSMQLSGYSVAPNDAHHIIRENATYVLESAGGHGFVREFIEKLLMVGSEEHLPMLL